MPAVRSVPVDDSTCCIPVVGLVAVCSLKLCSPTTRGAPSAVEMEIAPLFPWTMEMLTSSDILRINSLRWSSNTPGCCPPACDWLIRRFNAEIDCASVLICCTTVGTCVSSELRRLDRLDEALLKAELRLWLAVSTPWRKATFAG